MTDPDIVTRLRNCVAQFEFVDRHNGNVLTLAADEIERLRSERDEARREVCRLQPFAHHNDGIAKDHAAYRGWDCFKEER
jgi:uncharacterized protein YigA (DUF484 family)